MTIANKLQSVSNNKEVPNFSVSFYLRAGENNKKGKIYCRVHLGKKRSAFSTAVTVEVKQWKSTQQKVIGRGAEVHNIHLDSIRSKLHQSFQAIWTASKPLSIDTIIDNYIRLNGYSALTLEELCHKYLEKKKNEIDVHIVKRTYSQLKSRYANLHRFLIATKRQEMYPEDFSFRIAEEYEQYLRKECKHAHNHTHKLIQFALQVLNYAMEENIINHNPCVKFKIRFKDKPIIYLDFNEIATLERKEISINRLEKIRDLFLFQCYTGMSYVELSNFERSQIGKALVEGQYENIDWITVYRKKTNGVCYIPILPKAQEIINKYDCKLPVLSNTNYNAYLKELADICGINKKLTTHVGRKTCGMFLLNSGISLEAVSKILGHTSVKTTERHYANVLPTLIAKEVTNKGLM
jgi:integrase